MTLGGKQHLTKCKMYFRRGTLWIRFLRSVMTWLWRTLLESHWQTFYYLAYKHLPPVWTSGSLRLSHALHQFLCLTGYRNLHTPNSIIRQRQQEKQRQMSDESYVRLLQREEEEEEVTWPHTPPAGQILTNNIMCCTWKYWEKLYKYKYNLILL